MFDRCFVNVLESFCLPNVEGFNFFFLQIFGIFPSHFISVLVIFKPKRDEVTGEWRKLHDEKLVDLYFAPSIARVIKSRRMRWAGHVVRMGRGVAYTGVWWGNLVGRPEGKRPLGRHREMGE
jgi:hypothetical protein